MLNQIAGETPVIERMNMNPLYLGLGFIAVVFLAPALWMLWFKWLGYLIDKAVKNKFL